MKLLQNLEEVCVAIMKNPRATKSLKKQAWNTLEGLGVVDYSPKDIGEPPVSWDNLK